MNIGVHVSFWVVVLSRYMLRSEIAGPYGNSVFSAHSPAFVICRLFNGHHSDWYEMIPHCSFDLHFSHNQGC